MQRKIKSVSSSHFIDLQGCGEPCIVWGNDLSPPKLGQGYGPFLLWGFQSLPRLHCSALLLSRPPTVPLAELMAVGWPQLGRCYLEFI